MLQSIIGNTSLVKVGNSIAANDFWEKWGLDNSSCRIHKMYITYIKFNRLQTRNYYIKQDGQNYKWKTLGNK